MVENLKLIDGVCIPADAGAPAVELAPVPVEYSPIRQFVASSNEISSPLNWWSEPYVFVILVKCYDVETYKDQNYKKRLLEILNILKSDSKQRLVVYVVDGAAVDKDKDKEKNARKIFEKLKSDLPSKERVCRSDDLAVLTSLLRGALSDALADRLTRYSAECLRLEADRFSRPAGLFLSKDGLASVFLQFGLPDRSLAIYEELLGMSFSHAEQFRSPPGRLDLAEATSRLFDLSRKPFRESMLDGTISSLDMQEYLISKQMVLLAGQRNSILEAALRGHRFVSRVLRVHSAGSGDDAVGPASGSFVCSEMLAWAFCACLALVEFIHVWSPAAESDRWSRLYEVEADLLLLARAQLAKLAVRQGLTAFRWIGPPLSEQPTSPLDLSAISNMILSSALSSQPNFQVCYQQITTSCLKLFEQSPRDRHRLQLLADNAAIDVENGLFETGYEQLLALWTSLKADGWMPCLSYLTRLLIRCQDAMMLRAEKLPSLLATLCNPLADADAAASDAADRDAASLTDLERSLDPEPRGMAISFSGFFTVESRVDMLSAARRPSIRLVLTSLLLRTVPCRRIVLVLLPNRSQMSGDAGLVELVSICDKIHPGRNEIVLECASVPSGAYVFSDLRVLWTASLGMEAAYTFPAVPTESEEVNVSVPEFYSFVKVDFDGPSHFVPDIGYNAHLVLSSDNLDAGLRLQGDIACRFLRISPGDSSRLRLFQQRDGGRCSDDRTPLTLKDPPPSLSDEALDLLDGPVALRLGPFVDSSSPSTLSSASPATFRCRFGLKILPEEGFQLESEVLYFDCTAVFEWLSQEFRVAIRVPVLVQSPVAFSKRVFKFDSTFLVEYLLRNVSDIVLSLVSAVIAGPNAPSTPVAQLLGSVAQVSLLAPESDAQVLFLGAYASVPSEGVDALPVSFTFRCPCAETPLQLVDLLSANLVCNPRSLHRLTLPDGMLLQIAYSLLCPETCVLGECFALECQLRMSGCEVVDEECRVTVAIASTTEDTLMSVGASSAPVVWDRDSSGVFVARCRLSFCPLRVGTLPLPGCSVRIAAGESVLEFDVVNDRSVLCVPPHVWSCDLSAQLQVDPSRV